MASNDAHIAIGADDQHEGKHYEIGIGCWGNTKSIIRYENQGENKAEKEQTVLGGIEQPKTFEVDWSDGENIKVSTVDGDALTLLMQCKQDLTIPIKTMCVCTGFGSTGIWHIELFT